MCSPAMGYMSGFIWTGLHSVSGKTLHETPHIPHQCNQFDNPPTTSKYINGYNGMNVKTGWWFQPTPLKKIVSWDDEIPNIYIWKHNPTVPNHHPDSIGGVLGPNHHF